MQDNRPVAYYSRKLNSAQRNYATIDKELLCVVVTLREFQSMLLGAELHICTDHMNILLCWISYVDEYGPKIHYIEGPRNVIVDTFSRLLRKDLPSTLVGKKAAHVVSNSKLESLYSSLINDKEILQCFLTSHVAFSTMRKRKDQRNAGNILQTHIRWHVMETIIFVVPMLNIAISTSLKI
jgi:hypothetical protein